MLKLFKLFKVGHCRGFACLANRRLQFRKIDFPATVALLKHEKYGFILFDTGYSEHYFNEYNKLPFKLQQYILPAYLDEKDSLINQLNDLGLSSGDINYVIISHFHADHIGGLKDFPKARFLCSETAWASVRGLTKYQELKKAFCSSLLPNDFEDRLELLKNGDAIPLHGFPETWSLFDGLITLIKIDGHAQGQIGAIFEYDLKSYFLVADALWLKSNVDPQSGPHALTKFILDSSKDFDLSLGRIKKYTKTNPNSVLIPSHCEESFFNVSLNLGNKSQI